MRQIKHKREAYGYKRSTERLDGKIRNKTKKVKKTNWSLRVERKRRERDGSSNR